MRTDGSITAADGWHVGEDKTIEFHVFAPDATAAEIAADSPTARQDITGYTLRYELRDRPESTATIVAVPNITSGPSGVAEVVIPRAETEGLEPGTYEHVLLRTDPSEWTVLAGPTSVQLLPS